MSNYLYFYTNYWSKMLISISCSVFQRVCRRWSQSYDRPVQIKRNKKNSLAERTRTSDTLITSRRLRPLGQRCRSRGVLSAVSRYTGMCHGFGVHYGQCWYMMGCCRIFCLFVLSNAYIFGALRAHIIYIFKKKLGLATKLQLGLFFYTNTVNTYSYSGNEAA